MIDSTPSDPKAALNAALAPPAPTEPEERAATSMYQDVYNDITDALDRILGPDEEDGAGEGLLADVLLVASQRDDARAQVSALQADIARLVGERDEANRLVGAHRAMTIDANKALRDVLLAALGVEDDGKTPLAAYVALVIAQRDEARAEVARLRAEAVANREREHGPSGPWAKFILQRPITEAAGAVVANWNIADPPLQDIATLIAAVTGASSEPQPDPAAALAFLGGPVDLPWESTCRVDDDSYETIQVDPGNTEALVYIRHHGYYLSGEYHDQGASTMVAPLDLARALLTIAATPTPVEVRP